MPIYIIFTIFCERSICGYRMSCLWISQLAAGDSRIFFPDVDPDTLGKPWENLWETGCLMGFNGYEISQKAITVTSLLFRIN